MDKSTESCHILVSPLNWGLGHATRMIPVIRAFLKAGNRITVATSGAPLQLFKKEFEYRINYIEYNGVKVKYSKNTHFMWNLAMQAPRILLGVYREGRFTREMVKQLKPKMIISDNCYNFRHRKVFSVFIGHQLQIQMPGWLRILQPMINTLNHWFIRRFHMVAVPDHAGENSLSGILSHGTSLPQCHYCGPLSRFEGYTNHPIIETGEDLPSKYILVILSGPEPQRSLLEKELRKELKNRTTIWFLGKPGDHSVIRDGEHYIFNHAPVEFMARCLQHAQTVICRSGYSTLMDLSFFGKKAVLIPTPGQTEQEYLAHYFDERNWAVRLPQCDVGQIEESIIAANLLQGIPKGTDSSNSINLAELLTKRMNEFYLKDEKYQ